MFFPPGQAGLKGVYHYAVSLGLNRGLARHEFKLRITVND
jgi:hypothetical protein